MYVVLSTKFDNIFIRTLVNWTCYNKSLRDPMFKYPLIFLERIQNYEEILLDFGYPTILGIPLYNIVPKLQIEYHKVLSMSISCKNKTYIHLVFFPVHFVGLQLAWCYDLWVYVRHVFTFTPNFRFFLNNFLNLSCARPLYFFFCQLQYTLCNMSSRVKKMLNLVKPASDGKRRVLRSGRVIMGK